MRQKREYLRLLEKSLCAVEESVGAFNGVARSYKIETCLLLMGNAWELLAKAVLVKHRLSVSAGASGRTISAEAAVCRLKSLSLLDELQEDSIQQVISLRNCAAHGILPEVPIEIIHHLVFFSCKFFRETVAKVFPAYVGRLSERYLSVSFEEMTTYADKVQKLVAKVRKSADSRRLVWLLERGVKFDGTEYINQDEFEASYSRKKRVLPHLEIGRFIRNADMVRVVAVQAPRNFTANISLRKGNRADATLPVVMKRTDPEKDYPFLTSQLAEQTGKNTNFISAMIRHLGFKGNDQFHQDVPASRTTMIHRYSQAALEKINSVLKATPEYDPYRELKRMPKNVMDAMPP